MSEGLNSNVLFRALRKMIPNATLSVIHERPWHSLTFCGVQVCMCLVLSVDGHADVVARFATELPTHDFDLPKHIVADIAVTEAAISENQSRLIIDALLLDD
jgi:hypothetical protein